MTARWFTTIAAVLLALLLTAPAVGRTTSAENARPGTEGWERPEAADRAIEGYASQVSVLAGGELGLHVSTTPRARYRVEILRLGWYGGVGARRVACLPSCESSREGRERPVPPPDERTGLIRAGWPAVLDMPIGAGWASGLYAASLVLTSGPQAGSAQLVPFVVRDPAPAEDAILVQLPVNTWQAYNLWGGKSLYLGGPRASKVSFDRPFSSAGDDGRRRIPNPFEYPFVRFAEREGYELAYTTDIDVHRDPSTLLRHRAVVPLGHGEYWTREQRDALDLARDRGVHLAFLGANQGYWQSRLEDGERTLVVYRASAQDPEDDPALETVRFRHLQPPRPECELMGVQYQGGGTNELFGSSLRVPEEALRNPWMAAAGFAAGDEVLGTIDIEWDLRAAGCAVPAPPRVLFRFDGAEPAETVHHTAPSGAEVFSAGSLGFVGALDDGGRRGLPADPRVVAFVRAMLDDFVDRERPEPDPDPEPTPTPVAPDAGPTPSPPPWQPPGEPADPRPPRDLTAPTVRLGGRRLTVSRRGRVAVRLAAPGEPAAGRASLRAGGRALGTARLSLGERGRTVTVRLSRRARALLTARTRATLTITLRDASGNVARRAFGVTIVRARRR